MAGSESVTWTTAFGSTPIVAVAGVNATVDTNLLPLVTSRSTTGATLAATNAAVKLCIAQEAT